MQEQKVLEYESRMSLIKWDVFSMTFYQKMTDLRPASHALLHRPPYDKAIQAA